MKEEKLYKVAWNYDGKKHKAKVKSPLGRYEYCSMLEKEGATNIKIKYYAPYGEIVDSYIQGRSKRNFSSFQDYWKQLELF